MELYCRLCETTVKCDKTFHVDSHRKTAKHSRLLAHSASSSSAATQQFIQSNTTSLGEKIATAFVSADIPLHKLRHPAILRMFTDLGHVAPSESSCRQYVPKLYQAERQKLVEYVAGKQVFLVVDESEVAGSKYFNILVGVLDVPDKSYLFDCIPVDTVNHQAVCQMVDDTTRVLGVGRFDFLLLLSDAARYMTAAGQVLKSLL